MRVIERPFSEFLRQPNDVVAELGDHDVLLRRRNAPALRLSDADRDDQRSEAFEALGGLLRNLLRHSPDGIEQAVTDVFPWATFLPTDDRRAFANDLATVLSAVSSLDNFAPVGQLLREWKATAEIHADPELVRRLRRPIDADGDAVPSPN